MRRYLIQFSPLYKYGIVGLYFTLFLLYFLPPYDFYAPMYDYLSNVVGVSLFFCVREFYDAIIRRKCMWQKASIFGLSTYCVINMLYAGDYGNEYYDRIQFLSFFCITFYISAYIYVEELRDSYIKKNKKNAYI
jgi:hypothetical protein